jgi:hypothetical protein
MDDQATALRAGQMVLPLPELVRDLCAMEEQQAIQRFTSSQWNLAFVTALIETDGNGLQAVHKANEVMGAPRTTDGAAKQRAHKILHKQKNSQSVRRYVAMCREKAAAEAGVTQKEFYAGTRALMKQGLGEAKVRKSVVTRDDNGAVAIDEIEVYDPNPAAAGKALEMMGKALKIFGENLNVTAMTHEDALNELE